MNLNTLPFASGVMQLHELHLGSLGGDGQTMVSAMRLALDANFGGFERWREDFVALLTAHGVDARWALLTFLPCEGRLENLGVAPDAGWPDGGVPLLALDRHAPAGAGLDRIDWAGVYARYQAAVHAASEPFGCVPADISGALVIDVRRAGVFEQATQMMAGARWHDPAAVGQWATDLPRDQAVVVYCVHGHEVSRATALRLRAAGVDARYLRGGLEGWKAAGQALVAKENAP